MTFLGIVVGATVSLYLKKLDRRNAIEERHSAAREAAYDRILAAGDVAWYCHTKSALYPDTMNEEDDERIAQAAGALFQSGVDDLEKRSHDIEAIAPTVGAWFKITFGGPSVGARSFDTARDALVNLCRQETGLQNEIRQTRDLSFFERLRAGHVIQRLPDGIDQVIRTTDGEIIVSGSGESFIRVLHDALNLEN